MDRPALQAAPTRALRPLRRLVHELPYVRGGLEDRSVPSLPGRAGQLLGLARRLGGVGRVLRLVAVLPRPGTGREGEACTEGAADSEGAADDCPQGPRPVTELGSGR